MELDIFSVKSCRLYLLAGGAPEGVLGVGGRRRQPRISSSSPEPTVGIDRLEDVPLAALADEVALATGRVDHGDVVCKSVIH